MEFKATGKLIYDPVLGKDPIITPWWVILKTPQDIVEYYHYWFERIYGIKLLKPKWGSHISIIRNERPSVEKEHVWKHNDGKYIEFQYSNKFQLNHDYVWINTYGDELIKIREQLGIISKPQYNFHITIGKFPREIYTSFNSLFDVVKTRNRRGG